MLLALADLAGMTDSEIKAHVESEYKTSLSDVTFVVAYESVGRHGCDSTSYFVFYEDGKLYENIGSHCSCYGFEDQWTPSETDISYLTSDQFHFYCGGYDYAAEEHRNAVKKHFQDLFGKGLN